MLFTHDTRPHPGADPTSWQRVTRWLGLLAALLGGSSFADVALHWDPIPGVQGYRVHYGTKSGEYTQVIDVGASTKAQLTDLQPGRLHFCAVTSYTASGLESEFSYELPVFNRPYSIPAGASTGSLILLNAASATQPDSGALTSLTSSGSLVPDLVLDFHAPTDGTYSLWCRMRLRDESSPVEVHIDGERAGWLLPEPSPKVESADPEWFWTELQDTPDPDGVVLTEGTHLLAALVDGIEIDRLVLSRNPEFVPSDDLPREGDTIGFVRQPDPSLDAESGTAVILETEVVSTGPVHYQWFRDGIALDSQHEKDLQLDPSFPQDTGSYLLIASTGGAAVASEASLVTIIAAELVISQLARGNAGAIRFEVAGGFGQSIKVWASCDLDEWELIGTQQNTTGSIEIEDPESIDCPMRFYRLEPES